MLNRRRTQENFYWEINNPRNHYHIIFTVCLALFQPHVLSYLEFSPLCCSRRRKHLSTWFPCPLWAMCNTSGVSDQCQGASKNLASFDAQPHCLHPPRNILFLASGATRDTAENPSTAGNTEMLQKSRERCLAAFWLKLSNVFTVVTVSVRLRMRWNCILPLLIWYSVCVFPYTVDLSVLKTCPCFWSCFRLMTAFVLIFYPMMICWKYFFWHECKLQCVGGPKECESACLCNTFWTGIRPLAVSRYMLRWLTEWLKDTHAKL